MVDEGLKYKKKQIYLHNASNRNVDCDVLGLGDYLFNVYLCKFSGKLVS